MLYGFTGDQTLERPAENVLVKRSSYTVHVIVYLETNRTESKKKLAPIYNIMIVYNTALACVTAVQ